MQRLLNYMSGAIKLTQPTVWEASFPRQRVLNYMSGEIKMSKTKYTCLLTLLSAMDVTRHVKLLFETSQIG